MSQISQSLLSNPQLHHLTKTHRFAPLKTLNTSLKNWKPLSTNPIMFTSAKTSSYHLKAYSFNNSLDRDVKYGANDFNFDKILSIVEFFCLGSATVVSVVFVVNCVVLGVEKAVSVWSGSKMVVWQVVVLVIGSVIGAWIRKRQWRRICREEVKGGRGVPEVNLVGRIEKLEEDLRSAVAIIRALSRQLEKLGIRFRLTRKSLKDPIAETAALSQKNSEATRALAAQEDNLEKEFKEIQKVLLAMQQQQQKQLELILAVAKAGKLFDNNLPAKNTEQHGSADEGVAQKGRPLVQSSIKRHGIHNDQP